MPSCSVAQRMGVGIALGAAVDQVLEPAAVGFCAGAAFVLSRGPTRHLHGAKIAVVERRPGRLLTALVTLNAGYHFAGLLVRLDELDVRSQTLTSLKALPVLKSLPLPLPYDYITGFDRQKSIIEQQHPTFLNGIWRIEGFSNYLPLGLLVQVAASVSTVVAAHTVARLAAAARAEQAALDARLAVSSSAWCSSSPVSRGCSLASVICCQCFPCSCCGSASGENCWIGGSSTSRPCCWA